MTIIRCERFIHRTYIHQYLLFPAFLLKHLVEVFAKIFLWVFHSFFQRKRLSDNAGGVIFLGIFLFWSVIVFFLEKRELLVFLIFTFMLLLDQFFSKFLFHGEKISVQVNIGKKVTEVLNTPRQGIIRKYTFRNESVSTLLIENIEVRGKAFVNKICEVWRASILINNGKDRVIFHESLSLRETYKKARHLANFYGGSTCLYFKDSYGFGENGEILPQQHEQHYPLSRASDRIKVKEHENHTEIDCCWSFESYYNATTKILSTVVISLLLVVFINISAVFGELIISGFRAYVMRQNVFIGVYQYSDMVMNSFNLSRENVDIFEALALSLFFFSKELDNRIHERFLISKESLSYYLGNVYFDTMKIKDITNILVIKLPAPLLIITDGSKLIEIPGLQTDEEFQALLWRLALITGMHKEIR